MGNGILWWGNSAIYLAIYRVHHLTEALQPGFEVLDDFNGQDVRVGKVVQIGQGNDKSLLRWLVQHICHFQEKQIGDLLK